MSETEELKYLITSEAETDGVQTAISAISDLASEGDHLQTAFAGAQGAAGVLDDLGGAARDTGAQFNDLRGQALGAVQGLDDISAESNDAAKGLDEVGAALDDTNDKAGRAARGIQGMMVLQRVFSFLRDGVKLFGDALNRLAEGGDKDAQRLLTSLGAASSSWERMQDSVAKKTLPAVETWAKGVSLILDGQSQEQTALDATRRKADELNAAWDGLRQGQEAFNRVVYETPLPKLGEDTGLLGQRLHEVGGSLQDGAGRFGTWASAVSRANYVAGDLTKTLQAQNRALLDSAIAQASAILGSFASLGKGIDDLMAGGASGARNTAQELTKFLAEENRQRAKDTMQAGYDVSRWNREQGEWISDNEAGLTADLQAEFAARTKAAYEASLKVKDIDAEQARDLLANESAYQKDKAAIVMDPKLTEEERAAKLAALERDFAEEHADLAERARLRKLQADEDRAYQVESMRQAGAAGGKAFTDEMKATGLAEWLTTNLGKFRDFIATGAQMPTADIAGWRVEFEKAATAIAGLNIPEADKAALLALLTLAAGQMAIIESHALNAAAAAERIGREIGNPHPGWTPPPEMQEAGQVSATGLVLAHKGEVFFNPNATGGGRGFQAWLLETLRGRAPADRSAAAGGQTVIQVPVNATVRNTPDIDRLARAVAGRVAQEMARRRT
jgi:hypothetical protein